MSLVQELSEFKKKMRGLIPTPNFGVSSDKSERGFTHPPFPQVRFKSWFGNRRQSPEVKSSTLKEKVGGFTLVESVIMVFILALLLVALFSLYDWHGKVYVYQKAVVETTEQARFSTQTLQAWVNQAYRVESSVTLGGANYQSATTTLGLKLPSVNNQGQAIAGTWDYAAFYLDGKNLYIKVEPNASSTRPMVYKRLAESILNLEFVYDNPAWDSVRQVSVNLTTSIQAREQAVTSNFQQNLNLINYY